ncbi:(deoxy)nucleoside triphosphate pyrophosphohydrolase [Sphingomonas segetis]|uniref:(deoxy)nucleoside triphosphate pyrophosphohydrolase n=1 Tax=Sphingomonas segetis TaxID=1104779 RepID=UPI001E42A900|nr:(deoxy)nucleoside triphosphate pyrophosphohydrolase [Sphingomonas segetis]
MFDLWRVDAQQPDAVRAAMNSVPVNNIGARTADQHSADRATAVKLGQRLGIRELACCESSMSEAPVKQVAAAIVFHDRRVLVARRAPGQHLAGLWEFPGGKLEAGESPQCCIVRELNEELCLSVEARQTLTTSLYSYPGGRINLIAVLADAAKPDVALTVHDAIKWLEPRDLLSVEFAPADIPIAEEVSRRFA